MLNWPFLSWNQRDLFVFTVQFTLTSLIFLSYMWTCECPEYQDLLRSHRRGAQREILCSPQSRISKAVKRSSLRRTADWLTVYTEQVWLRLPGRPDLARFTLSEGSSGVMYSRCVCSFPPSMQLAFLPLNSLGWMESDNPPTADSCEANWLITA